MLLGHFGLLLIQQKLLGNQTDLNGASNEVLSFSANFGTDTVLNFDAGLALGVAGSTTGTTGAIVDGAEDLMDFTAITGVGNNFLIGTAPAFDTTATGILPAGTGSVDVVDFATNAGLDLNTNGKLDAAEIVAAVGAGDAIASNHIVIVYNSANTTDNNAGEVWHVVDGVAAVGDVTATSVGTINLVGTDWANMNIDNFG